VPALDTLVPPRTDARGDQQIRLARIIAAVPFDEPQRAMHSAGFVSVDAAGDQYGRQRIVPASAADGEQRITVGRIVEPAVFGHIETVAQGVDAIDDLRPVTALRELALAPLRLLGVAPRLAGDADRIKRM